MHWKRKKPTMGTIAGQYGLTSAATMINKKRMVAVARPERSATASRVPMFGQRLRRHIHMFAAARQAPTNRTPRGVFCSLHNTALSNTSTATVPPKTPGTSSPLDRRTRISAVSKAQELWHEGRHAHFQ
jgi:hypothetical protein